MLDVTVEHAEHCCLVKLTGDINMDTVDDLRRALLSQVAEAAGTVTIDASNVGYMYTGGLAVLVELQTRLGASGGELRILNPTPLLRDLLKVTALDKFVSIEEDEESL